MLTVMHIKLNVQFTSLYEVLELGMCLHKTVNNVRIVINSASYGYTMYSSVVYKC